MKKKRPCCIRSCVFAVVALVAACSGGDPVATSSGHRSDAGGLHGQLWRPHDEPDGRRRRSRSSRRRSPKRRRAASMRRSRSSTESATCSPCTGWARRRTRLVTITHDVRAAATISGGLEGIRCRRPCRVEHRSRGRDREGGHRRVSLLGRQRVLVAHRDARSCRSTSIRANSSSRPGRCSACSSASSRAPTLMRAFDGVGPSAGPQRSPLGSVGGSGRLSAVQERHRRRRRRRARRRLLHDRRGHRRRRRRRRRGDRVRGDVRLRRAGRSARRSHHRGRQDAALQRRRLRSAAQQSRDGAGFRDARGLSRAR